MKNNLNLNSSAEFSSFNRKKNPRDMTVQELDEYIKKIDKTIILHIILKVNL